MKRKLFLLISIICCLVLTSGLLVACNPDSGEQNVQPGGGDGGKDEILYFTVTFDTQGGSNIADITVENGQVIGGLMLPTKQCSRLVGFALDADGERMWDVLTDTVSANMTLYAIWEDAHDFEEGYTVDIAPGCETTGSESRHCTRCDAKTDSREIAALGHDHEGAEWHYNDVNHWKYCIRCGQECERELHFYASDGVCECGMIEVAPVEECHFVLLSNNTWQLAVYFGNRTNVSIPSTYNNGTVVSIGNEAFSQNTTMQTLVIPDSVKSIGESAFYGCGGLTSVSIGSGVTSIGSSAFRNCSGLTSVTIPGSVTSIGEGAFYNCNRLEEITIPFVGKEAGKTSSDTYQYPFGYIFGISYYTTGVTQRYYGSSPTRTTSTVFNIPSSLRSVTVTGGNILYGAFSNCSMLTSVTMGKGVTSIGRDAFYDCSSLTSVTIPDSVTSIGKGAFMGCSRLEEITIPFVGDEAGKTSSDTYQYPFGYIFGTSSYTGGKSVTQFYYDYNPLLATSTTFYIPSSLRSVTVTGGNILYGAFSNCSMLTSVTMGKGVTSIDNSAFSGCSLTSIYYLGDMTSWLGKNWHSIIMSDGCTLYINGSKVEGEVIIPNGVKNIPSRAFAYQVGITSVTIPDSVTSIGSYAFDGCSGLTSVSIGSGVTSIGSYAFDGCSGLTSVTIPGSVTSIGDYAFYRCGGLTSITIPDSVTSIGNRAFYRCSGLTSVSIGSGVTSIGWGAFNGCSGLTSVAIPDSVTDIGDEAFYDCSSLTSITIPDSVTSIGDYAFYRCGGLTSVSIGSGVTSIGDYAFYGCRGFTSITIPDSVTSIGDWAFARCSGLTSVTIGNGVTMIEGNAFAYCRFLTSVTYNGTISEWNAISKVSGWHDECPFTEVVCSDGTVKV